MWGDVEGVSHALPHSGLFGLSLFTYFLKREKKIAWSQMVREVGRIPEEVGERKSC